MQRAEVVAAGDGGVCRGGFLAGTVGAELDDGIEGGVDLLDAGKVGFEDFGG